MKTDFNGTSTTAAGEEKYEPFTSGIGRRRVKRYQYDYRHTDGELFSCCASTVKECRKRRDAWLEKKGIKEGGDENVTPDVG